MSWPTPQDYNEAVQNPRTCFSDPELKRGAPALTPLGLPRVISGAFASVYRMNCPGRNWAVRCFLREYADQQRRYAAISDHLKAAGLPCMIDFEFLREGIRVAGRWYPILKMQWVEGDPLDVHIANNLNRPDVLKSLSRQWIDVMASLGKARIAHGDLQHGNVLVSGGELKLIDYDAMFVPALKGLESHEEGHRNYQHPARTGRDFHPDIDNFSAWVVFTSISALAINPGLWKRTNAGDECLLFRREDFEDPRRSEALRASESSGDDRLRTLVLHFRSILDLPFAQVPSLDGPILDPLTGASQGPGRTAPGNVQGRPSWLDDHVPRRNGPAPIVVGTAGPRIGGAEWIFDHLIDGGSPVAREPVVTGPLDLMSQRRAAKDRLGNARLQTGQIEDAINLARLERSRLGEPLAAIKAARERLPRSRDDEIGAVDREATRALEGVEDRRRRARRDHEAGLKRLDGETAKRSLKLEQDLATALIGVEGRRSRGNESESREVGACRFKLASELGGLDRERADLASEEKAKVDRSLRKSRALHVALVLAKAEITTSAVVGIGAALARRLKEAGVVCASDVTYDRVRTIPGIGDAKADALVEWSRSVKQRADRSAPSSLSRAEMDRMRDEYASKMDSIDRRIASAKDAHQAELRRIAERYASGRRDLDEEERAIKRDFDARRSALPTLDGQERRRLDAELAAALQRLDAEEQTARREHERKRRDVATRFDRERDRLAAEENAEATRAAEAVKKLDVKLVELNQALFERRREVHKLARELERLENISIFKTLVSILSPWRDRRRRPDPGDAPEGG